MPNVSRRFFTFPIALTKLSIQKLRHHHTLTAWQEPLEQPDKKPWDNLAEAIKTYWQELLTMLQQEPSARLTIDQKMFKQATF